MCYVRYLEPPGDFVQDVVVAVLVLIGIVESGTVDDGAGASVHLDHDALHVARCRLVTMSDWCNRFADEPVQELRYLSADCS